MRRLFSLLVFAAVLAGGYFLLRPHVFWLDYFEGAVIERVERQVPTLIDRRAQDISEYFLVVKTDDGREVSTGVEQLLYFRSRSGMRVSKSPFSSSVSLIE